MFGLRGANFNHFAFRIEAWGGGLVKFGAAHMEFYNESLSQFPVAICEHI
jgi:hypothetical protein